MILDPNILTLLISAMCIVESGGNPDAIGDNSYAVGILQQHPIFVDEVNRILTLESDKRFTSILYTKDYRFTYDDRKNPDKAEAMARIWFTHNLRQGKSLEECIRRYNAGKNWKGKQAEKYYKKVMAEMKSQAKK